MSGMHYALVQELWTKPPLFMNNGVEAFPSNIAKDDDKYYKIYDIADNSRNFSPKHVQKFAVMRVERILESGDGQLQWRILN